MITKKKFVLIVKQLESKYGENKFPPSSKEYLFNELKNSDFEILQKAIGDLCANEQFTPTLSDIRKYYDKNRPENKKNYYKLTQSESENVSLFHKRRCAVRVNQLIKNGYTLEALKKYYLVWCAKTMGKSFSTEMGLFDLPLDLFWQIAIEDLFLSGGNPEKAFIRAVKKKDEKIHDPSISNLKGQRLIELRDMKYFYEQHSKKDWQETKVTA